MSQHKSLRLVVVALLLVLSITPLFVEPSIARQDDEQGGICALPEIHLAGQEWVYPGSSGGVTDVLESGKGTLVERENWLRVDKNPRYLDTNYFDTTYEAFWNNHPDYGSPIDREKLLDEPKLYYNTDPLIAHIYQNALDSGFGILVMDNFDDPETASQNVLPIPPLSGTLAAQNGPPHHGHLVEAVVRQVIEEFLTLENEPVLNIPIERMNLPDWQLAGDDFEDPSAFFLDLQNNHLDVDHWIVNMSFALLPCDVEVGEGPFTIRDYLVAYRNSDSIQPVGNGEGEQVWEVVRIGSGSALSGLQAGDTIGAFKIETDRITGHSREALHDLMLDAQANDSDVTLEVERNGVRITPDISVDPFALYLAVRGYSLPVHAAAQILTSSDSIEMWENEIITLQSQLKEWMIEESDEHDYLSPLVELIAAAEASNLQITFVAAAGNYAESSVVVSVSPDEPLAPARWDSVIAVSGTPADQMAKHTEFNSGLYSAPGAWYFNKDYDIYVAGTSFAAPAYSVLSIIIEAGMRPAGDFPLGFCDFADKSQMGPFVSHYPNIPAANLLAHYCSPK
jgi:hypothetical protein